MTLEEIAESEVAKYPHFDRSTPAPTRERIMLMRFGLAYSKKVYPERLVNPVEAVFLFGLQDAFRELTPVPLYQILGMTEDETVAYVERENKRANVRRLRGWGQQ
jgi:hypothetical protein